MSSCERERDEVNRLRVCFRVWFWQEKTGTGGGTKTRQERNVSVKADNFGMCRSVVCRWGSFQSQPAASLHCLLNITRRSLPHFGQFFSIPNTHMHQPTHTSPPSMFHRPLSAPLEDNIEEKLSLLEHFRQIQHYQTDEPRIHPSSPAHLISAVKGHRGVGQRRGVVVKRGN